jgi:hypothetical protein
LPPPGADNEDVPVVKLAPPPRLSRWVRRGLVLIALGWGLVFGVAAWINPYDEAGQPKRMETHRQLGLPPCNFKVISGQPCPSCGMTTSFALLVHGDLKNSLAANWVGALLAGFGLLVIPWCLAGAWRGRYLWVRSGERLLTAVITVYLCLTVLRWGIVVAPAWLFGSG